MSVNCTTTTTPKRRANRTTLAADERHILEVAAAAGWTVRKRHVTKKKHSRYLKLRRPDQGKVTVRISNHLPTRPVESARRMLLHVPGVPWSLGAVIAWLSQPQAEGGAA